MLNFLDLLVVVFMVLAAFSLLAVSIMFLARNPKIKKVCFYIVAAFSIYAGYVGIRIGTFHFPVQTAVGVLTIVVTISAIVSVIRGKEKKTITREQIIVTGALVAGLINAFML